MSVADLTFSYKKRKISGNDICFLFRLAYNSGFLCKFALKSFKVDVRVSQSYTNETGGKVGGDVVENIADSIVEKLSTTRAKIVRIICKNPNATAQSISKEINIASRNVQEHLRKLQEQGVIRRIGPDKGGHWEIIAP